MPFDLDNFSVFSHSVFFPYNVFCFFCRSAPKESRLPQFSIPGPLAKSKLGNQFGSDPMHIPSRQVIACKRRCFDCKLA